MGDGAFAEPACQYRRETDGEQCGQSDEGSRHVHDPPEASFGTWECHAFVPPVVAEDPARSRFQNHVEALSVCPAKDCGRRTGGTGELIEHIENALGGKTSAVYRIKSGEGHMIHVEEVPGTKEYGCEGAHTATCDCGWSFGTKTTHVHRPQLFMEAGFHLGLMTATEMIRMRDLRSSDGYHRTKVGA